MSLSSDVLDILKILAEVLEGIELFNDLADSDFVERLVGVVVVSHVVFHDCYCFLLSVSIESSSIRD